MTPRSTHVFMFSGNSSYRKCIRVW